MGILDEAIREHLDLKRRHGAGEDEVKLLEDEAFGPPSRPGEPDFPGPPAEGEAPAGVQPDGSEAVVAPEETTTIMPGGLPEAAAPAEATEAPAEPAFEPPSEEAVLPEAPIESLETVEHAIEEAPSEELPVDEPPSEEYHLEEQPSEELPLEEPPSEEAPYAEPPSEEAPIHEEPAEEGEGDDGDVLEETPEFLRDQPEDDELWFEQGEPKDFDF